MENSIDTKENRKTLEKIEISSIEFAHILASSNERSSLTNDQNSPLVELVHPLIYSKNAKKHPDMLCVPACYKFQRNFYYLFKELKKE